MPGASYELDAGLKENRNNDQFNLRPDTRNRNVGVEAGFAILDIEKPRDRAWWAPEAARTGTDPPRRIYSTVEQDDRPPDPNILYLKPHWPLADACITIPGYDIPILPASAPLQAAIYWSTLWALPN